LTSRICCAELQSALAERSTDLAAAEQRVTDANIAAAALERERTQLRSEIERNAAEQATAAGLVDQLAVASAAADEAATEQRRLEGVAAELRAQVATQLESSAQLAQQLAASQQDRDELMVVRICSLQLRIFKAQRFLIDMSRNKCTSGTPAVYTGCTCTHAPTTAR
jgi:chromosome segregation ATPase